MVWQAFNIWDEDDPLNRLTQTATRSTWTAMIRGDTETALSEDFGAGFIDLAWTYQCRMYLSDIDSVDVSNNTLAFILVAHNVPGAQDPDPSPRLGLIIVENGASDTDYRLRVQMRETGGVTESDDSSLLDVGTVYYVTLVRSNDGKTLTATIRTGSHAGPIEDTITVTNVLATETYRYLKCPQKQDYGDDVNDGSTGYIEFLDMDPSVEEVGPQGTVVHKAMAMLIT